MTYVQARDLPETIFEQIGRQLEANRRNFGEYEPTEVARQVIAGLVLLGYDVIPQVAPNGRQPKDGSIGGKELRGELARILIDGQPRHYRELTQLLAKEGKRIRGVDPEATLLTALTRVPGIVRHGSDRSGIYRLERPDRERLHARLDAANERNP